MLLQVLLALAAVILTGQILARVLTRFGQPPVIGEVLAGILLGPSLIGPELSSRILPPAIAPALGIIAQLGVILYMFVVGLELETGKLRSRGRSIVIISWASILLPFALGLAIAPILFERVGPPGVPRLGFALFMGVAMSVTAFPVLARILKDRGMDRSPVGVIALSAAAIDDVTAWCLLAIVVGITQAQIGGGLRVIGMAAGYVAVMFLVVRPLAQRWTKARAKSEAGGSDEYGALPQARIAVMFLALLLSAIATEAIGIHAIFGAFLFGALIPEESPIARALSAQLRGVVTVLLLPAFFAFTGMRTRIDLVAGVEAWLLCGLIILVAVAGKFLGTLAGGRLTGLGWRDASILGVLMNTRGLMELIVLNIGLELGVISPALFAMMVIMALTTTIMTGPLLALAERRPI
ncbi:MAG: cation:proton antiporter [Acidobacteriota bacterium]|nr:cation:proton antiporter [Acidobacteriota bacterium]